jgi:NTP pyrophosphatase (non-canonical NTP hydrolase)
MKWTQETITEWSTKTFGERSPLSTAVRANKEMAELLSALENGELEVACKEVADIVIILMQVAERLGMDLNYVVQLKMNINEKRQWEKKEDGSYGHV